MAVKLALSTVPIFQFVPTMQLAKLGGIARIVEKRTGDAVLIHDEVVLGIYVIGEGRVGVYPKESAKPLVYLGQGESFGEMSFLEKSTASATIRAEDSSTKLAVFLQTDIARIVESDPLLGSSLYRGIALSLSRKLRATTGKFTNEMRSAGSLLQELMRREDGELALASLARDTGEQNKKLFTDVDACLRLTEDLLRRFPERAAGIQELQMALSGLKSRVRQFYPVLEQKVQSMAGFLSATEEFLALTVRD